MRIIWKVMALSLSLIGLAQADLVKGTRATIPVGAPLCNILSIESQIILLQAGIQKPVKGCTMSVKPQEAIVLMNYENSKMGPYSRWYLIDTEEESFIPNSVMQ